MLEFNLVPLLYYVITGCLCCEQQLKALNTDGKCKMWNVINLFWLHTEDKDLHPRAPELLGVALHCILRCAICDDHQHFGKTRPGAGRLVESVSQDKVEGIACSDTTDRFHSAGIKGRLLTRCRITSIIIITA